MAAPSPKKFKSETVDSLEFLNEMNFLAILAIFDDDHERINQADDRKSHRSFLLCEVVGALRVEEKF